jgi:hypothetical protein
LIVALLWWNGNVLLAADQTEFQLDARVSYGYGEFSDTTMQTIIEATPKIRFEITPSWRAEVSGRLRLDFEDELEPGRARTDSYSNLSRPVVIDDLGTFELRDVYIERRLKHGVLRVGKQQIVWGKLDGIKVLDVLNPQNFREFILEDFSASRISLWSAYLDVTKSGWRGELAVIPDNTGHVVPAQGAWFELTAPRYRYGSGIDDPAPATVTRRESVSADTSAVALRVSRQFGALELGAIAYSGMDHEPLGRITGANGETIVERFYERRDLYGISAETAFGAFALRAEVASQPERTFNTRDPLALDTVKLDQLTAGVGLDIDGPLNTFINVQYVLDEVRSAPATLVRPAEDRIVTVFLGKNFSYETFRVSARWYRSQELGDSMMSVALRFLPSDSTRMGLTYDRFSGSANGVFGQFANKDRIALSLEHTF